MDDSQRNHGTPNGVPLLYNLLVDTRVDRARQREADA